MGHSSSSVFSSRIKRKKETKEERNLVNFEREKKGRRGKTIISRTRAGWCRCITSIWNCNQSELAEENSLLLLGSSKSSSFLTSSSLVQNPPAFNAFLMSLSYSSIESLRPCSSMAERNRMARYRAKQLSCRRIIKIAFVPPRLLDLVPLRFLSASIRYGRESRRTRPSRDGMRIVLGKRRFPAAEDHFRPCVANLEETKHLWFPWRYLIRRRPCGQQTLEDKPKSAFLQTGTFQGSVGIPFGVRCRPALPW